jgi:chondroitin 4-sulfotransferase 11
MKPFALLKERYLQDFVFIHINKTGGSSVEKALGIRHEHRTALEKRAELGEKCWAKKFTFAIVRNPWDKVVSHYHYRVQTNQTDLATSPVNFAEWVRRAYSQRDPDYYDKPKMFMPQLDWITDTDGKIMVNQVARFETLQKDFDAICQRLNRTAQLPQLRKSERGDYRQYYDAESQAIVAQCFAKDIAEFGYRYE